MYSYIYRFFQSLILKRSFYDDVLEIINYANKFNQVVEIGCADSLILKKLKLSFFYHGYEIEKNYILKSKKLYKNEKKYSFFNKGIDQIDFRNYNPKKTIIIIVGVFHHVDSNKIKKFMEKTKDFTVYAIDAVRIKDQNFLTKFLLNNDKGKFVRHIDDYKKLLKDYDFLIARNMYLRFPYDHLVSTKNIDYQFLKSIFKKNLFTN